MNKPKPLVSVGWILAVDEPDEAVIQAYQQAGQHLLQILSPQFPQFQWEMSFKKRRRYTSRGALDPLPLLELGVQEKINEGWDFALIIVPNELNPHQRITTIGIPSSALEVAVLSSASLESNPDLNFSQQVAGLGLHLLGHMWGLEHREQGPMRSPGQYNEVCLAPFPSQQQEAVVDRLEEVADQRLEERPDHWGWFSFHWRAFWADPKGILTDIWGYKPWRLPFRMGRLTGAAGVSLIFMLLGAEAWEIGVNSSLAMLGSGMLMSVLGATLFVFFGQNLSQISREGGRREQLARTRIVLFFTLLLGMMALWGFLFAISYLATLSVPHHVSGAWLDIPLDSQALARQAAFMATLGVFAGAIGGNLEEENKLKAQLFYDEET